MSNNPAFCVGQTVIATGSYGFHLTLGKSYVITCIQPEEVTPTFTWPEYVQVQGDHGQKVTGHAHRFRPIEPLA